MIDTAHFRIPRIAVSNEQVVDLHDKLSNRSNYAKEQEYADRIYYHKGFSGNYHNFNIQVDQYSISINGSLAKYYFGNNVSTLNFNQTKETLYRLQRQLNMPILKHELARIDIAENFFLPYNVRHCFLRLLDTPTYDRQYDPKKSGNGVRYRKGPFVFCFYNKTSEAAHVPDMPLLKPNDNLLRIEMRIMKNVRRTIMNQTEKFGAVYLLSPAFHRKLAVTWLEHFNAIFKERHLRDTPLSNSWKGFEDYLVSFAIHKLGHMQALDLLQLTAESNDWVPRHYSKGKKNILHSYNSTASTVGSEHLEMLSNEVVQGYIYALANSADTQYPLTV
jgi:hypothetical protein